ncbi:MAG TPA: Gfo/Idh/MocA family oxidoreductase [Planctomycetota bacterium]|jgi:hypothetical protein
MTPKRSRREFLRGAAAAIAAPWIVPASALGADGATSPSKRVTLGLIGVGCMGSGHLNRVIGDPTVQLLAVCEVDRSRRETAKARADEAYAAARASGAYKGCDVYNDYREVLERKDIDGVIVVTPDHWHTPIAIDAAKAGKDVYCEKPVSLTIQEGRVLSDTMTRYGTVFQTGTQYRSITRIRKVCEFVRGGGLGRIKQVFTLWGKYNMEGIGHSYVTLDPALPAEPVPEGLDWNQWVGPAPWHNYNQAYHRNPIPGVVPWVFCDAFGAVAITGYHSHSADVIQWSIGMETSGPVDVIHPSSGQFPTLTCRYANGVLLHHVEHWGQVKQLYKGAVPDNARLEGNFGGVFVGERGWITSMSTGGPIEGGPEPVLREAGFISRDVILGDNNHHENWFNCVRTRGRTSTHAEIGHRSASLGHLVMISYRLGRSLKWNPVKEEFAGDEQANSLRSRPMRAPWKI